MKNKFIKISLAILISALTIFGIYNLTKNEELISNIFASPVEQLADNSNFPDEFTVSELNRFFVPYKGDYHIYCDNRSTSFLTQTADWYRGGSYPITKLTKSITYKKSSGNSWENITENQKKQAAYIFSVNDATGSYSSYTNGFNSLSDADKFAQFNKFPSSLVDWYTKQQAYWLIRGQGWGTWATVIKNNRTELNWNASTGHFQDVDMVNGEANGKVVQEVKKLVTEASMYNEYANNGSQTLKLNTTEPTVTKSNGVYTVSQLNVIHTGYTKTVGNNTINFSGISGIYVEYYNKNGTKVGENKISTYTQANSQRTAKYFSASGEKIDRNSEIMYPKSGENFSIKFNDPNKGKTSKDNNWVTNFKIRVEFEYMTAEYNMKHYVGTYTGSKENAQPVYIVNSNRKLQKLTETINGGDIIEEGKYDLDIKKVSSSNTDVALSGARFNLYKYRNNKWETISTNIFNNTNGVYNLTSVKVSNANTEYYWITEIAAPSGYERFTGGIKVRVEKELGTNTNGVKQYMVKAISITAYKNADPNAKTNNVVTPPMTSTISKDKTTITLIMENEPSYDLALRKFITSINGKAPTVTRVPSIATSELTALKNGTKTTAVKSHPKDALVVTTGDKVVYTMRVYNEGTVNGKATQITDYLPEGLKLAENSTINTTYGWTNPSKDGKTMVSEYLKDKEIAAFNGTTLAYRDVQIECEVTATKAQNLKNIAEITDDDGADRDSTPKNVNRSNYGSTSQEDDDDFELLKLKPTLKLSGIVWEDLRGGKETLANGLKDSNEKGIEGITVVLHNKSNSETKTTTTNSSGYYEFKGLDVDKAYYITFTYNGQEYENTLYRKNGKDTGSSQAYEPQAARDSLNKGLEEIDGDEGYKLEDISKYITNISKFKITAQTETYNNEKKSDENKVISNINFGITKRIEFDMKLEKDVYAATVTVNGKTQTYGYNKKNIQDSISNFESLSETEKEKALSNWTITVVEGDYQRAIAEPDYNFTGVNGNGKTLELYVTYKVAVKNQSMSMLGEATKIKDYYDSTYTYVPELSWTSSKNYSTNDLTDVRGRIVDSLQNSKTISKGQSESTVNINSNTNNTLDIALSGKLQSGEAKYLYLTFKVKKDESGKVITGTKTNTAEIAAFKSYYKKGTVLPCYNGENKYEVKNNTTIAGRVDRDSIPNNLNKSNGPKEDDENNAPGLNVKVEGDRTITGTVWEDARNNKVDDSVIGDGVYNNKDTKIDIAKEGIKVELYRAKSEKQFELVKDAKLSIDGNKYTFSNVVAGDYIVRFTYGDGTVKYNGQDYKTTIYQDYGDSDKYNLDVSDENLSRAADLWDVRTTLNASSAANVKNEMAEKLAKGEGSKMIADTKTIVAEIEYNRQVTTENPAPGYAIKGVNLGLVERPKAQLELNKTVSNIKVTLADGSILFDVNQSADNVAWKPNTAYNIDSNKKNGIYDKKYRPTIGSNAKGLVQLSMDEEIMHGATIQITYKIKVKNVGEVDYEGKEFYYTGKNHGNTVTTTPNRIIDYVSNNLQFNSNSNTNDWQVMTVNDVINNKLVNADVAGVIFKDDKPQYNTILTTTFSDTLKPGDSTAEKTLVLTQTITPENTSDNLKYINIAEIVETSNTAGRRMAYSIVGNQNPTEAVAEVDASSSEEVMILPPFGDTHIYYILGTVIGIILIGGIAFIIRKVLKK